MKKVILLFLSLSSFCHFSVPAQERGELISDTLLRQYDRQEILAVYLDFNLPESFFPVLYDVEIHRLVYRTSAPTGDSLTVASGLITVPVGEACAFPLVSYQHGTLPYDSVLSDMNAKFGQHLFGIPFAANGYVTALPDYPGLGVTTLPHHPFYHAGSEAGSVIDMLRASRLFCASRGVALNDQVFLLGYSQGGHSTMAAHREIEAAFGDEFLITASAPGGGAYDLSGLTRDSLLFSEGFSNPFFIGYTLLSYQYVYGNIYEVLSDAVISPYDTILLRIFNRENPDSRWLDSLPWPGTQIFQPSYLEAFISDTLHPLNVALRDNDVYDWVPQAPLRLFYCEGDEVVPHQNSTFTFGHMIGLGATSVSIANGGPGYDHATCTYPATVTAKLWFDTFREVCPLLVAGKEGRPVIHFYPNPFRDQIRVKGSAEDLRGFETISLYDPAGRRLWSTSFGGQREWTVPALQPGMYFLQLEGADNRFGQPLIRQ